MNERDRTTVARDLPWPYNGIMRDLTVAVEAGANYLAALGLICYSEFLGRRIAEMRNEPPGTNFDCFKRFVCHYMGYDLGSLAGAVYGSFRDGLVHEYFIKGRETAVATELHQLDPAERVAGLAFDPTGGLRVFFVREYFRDFEAGLRKWLAEGGRPH
jgi:hypothetical protein